MRTSAIGIAVWAVLGLASAAQAGVVTYPGPPLTVDDGMMVTSQVTVPGGRPPVTDLDVAGVQVSGGAGFHNDQVLSLLSSRARDVTVDLMPGCQSLGLNIDFDDQAGSKFANPDCTATGTRQPFAGRLRDLMFEDPANGHLEADGTWTMRFWDMNGPAFMAEPATLSSWALRVTYEPMTFTAEAEKQPLRKTVEVTVKCSSACDIRPGGDARPGSFHASKDSDKLKLPLTKKARRRLRKRGKGKVNLSLQATNSLNDAISRSLRVKLTKK
jgi:hypothetical protein